MRRLNDLRELGAAWAEINSAKPPKATKPERERVLRPYGDRHICPCGKVSYASREEAKQAAREVGSPQAISIYRCPLGHPVYHLTHRRKR